MERIVSIYKIGHYDFTNNKGIKVASSKVQIKDLKNGTIYDVNTKNPEIYQKHIFDTIAENVKLNFDEKYNKWEI